MKLRQNKLWSGRFGEDTNELLDEFNASLPFDKNLWREDIAGSMEHARMLREIGILSDGELDSILRGLDSIYRDISTQDIFGHQESGCDPKTKDFDTKNSGTSNLNATGLNSTSTNIKDIDTTNIESKNNATKSYTISAIDFLLDIKNEDIHMAIESELSRRIGESGKKLHTARSRNDQVALDFKLYCRNQNLDLQKLLKELIATLLDIASQHTLTLMPGMTHLQHAQPVSLAFHLISWSVALRRDCERLQDFYERSSECPLGAAAFAGSPYNNEREKLARRLGFKNASLNAMDSVSQRDFALDMLYGVAMIMLHISRMAEELVLWSSAEFGFITFSDSFSTGSSIMPQKKNPDVAELLRGKSGRSFGNLIALLTTMKALPMAYNKDMQEDKEVVFDSIGTAKMSLTILNASLKELEIHKQNMLKMCQKGHLVATDLADFLVKKCGIPFREAHYIVGICVKEAESAKVDLSQMEIESLVRVLDSNSSCGLDSKKLKNDYYKNLKADLADILNLESCMQRRNSIGGTASSEVERQIGVMRWWLKNTNI